MTEKKDYKNDPKYHQWPFALHEPGKCRMDDGHACTCSPPWPKWPPRFATDDEARASGDQIVHTRRALLKRLVEND